MIGSTGLRNFVKNINPVILKCRKGEKLTKDEQGQIVQFYLEVIQVLVTNPEEEGSESRN